MERDHAAWILLVNRRRKRDSGIGDRSPTLNIYNLAVWGILPSIWMAKVPVSWPDCFRQHHLALSRHSIYLGPNSTSEGCSSLHAVVIM